MVLGLLVTAGLIQLFVSSRQTYRMQETSARLQEDGRFALDNITETTHMAAYLGCANLYRFGLKTVGGQQVRGPRVIAINAPQFNDSNLLQAYDHSAGAWIPPLPANLIGGVILGAQTLNVATGTDVLTVTGGSPCITHLAQDMGNRAANLSLQGNACGYQPNNVLLISDCLSNADLFRATNVQVTAAMYQRPLPGGATQGTSIPIFTVQHGLTNLNGGPANTSDALSPPTGYKAPVPGAENVAQVMQLRTRTYFVAPSLNAAGATPAQCRTGQAVCSLWEFDGVNYNELVEGVQDMQLTYGIDNGDENADLYVTPTAPNFRIANVMSLRIAILMLSAETGMAASAQPLLAAGTNFAGVFNPPAGFNPNGRLARVFTTTVNLRNRTLDFAP